jgi:hypothetical protein
MAWGLHPSLLQTPQSYRDGLDEISKRANKLLRKSRVQIQIKAPDGEQPLGDNRKTLLAHRAAVMGGKDIDQLRADSPASFFGFDVQFGPGPVFEARWSDCTTMVIKKDEYDEKVCFCYGKAEAQPTPCLTDHRLDDGELAQVISDLRKGAPKTRPLTWQAKSPIALVLNVLRHDTKRRLG